MFRDILEIVVMTMFLAIKTNKMKDKLFIILTIFLFQTSILFSQKSLTISTNELFFLEKEFGVDTIRKIFHHSSFENVLLIDSVNAINIALNILKNDNVPYDAIGIARRTKNVELAEELLKYYCNLPKYKFDKRNKIIYKSIDYELLNILYTQNPVGFMDTLKNNFEFWDRTSIEIKKNYPNGFMRFWQYIFSGMPYSVEQFQTCKCNSLKLAKILNKLKCEKFNEEILKKLENEQVGTYCKNYECKDIELQKLTNNKNKIVKIKKSYSSIISVLNDTSTIYNKVLVNKLTNDEYCYCYKVYNRNKGILIAGCQLAPLAGHGEIYLVTIISENEVEFEMIGGWIS